ncbi:MAG TPA: hypothetical protein VJY15_07245 [Candidatus Acidoferrum sp.]|jgi:hypothetical protein|nr:hypothetical protein [Candidatus Acidoferrum sp.]
MSFLAFPLRLEGGFLRRCPKVDAIVSLVSVMARTPHGSWIGSRHFGLREFFEEARAQTELPSQAIQELNLSLQDLGILEYRVQEIVRESQTQAETSTYVLRIVSASEGGQAHSVRLVQG